MRCLGVLVVMAVATACLFGDSASHPLVRDQRLPSGRTIHVISCLLVWGVEHDERHPDQDAFALEYVSSTPRVPPQELEREAVEAFELIRPISEQWGFSTATVTALRTAERTGTYDVFAFTRSAGGTWAHTVQQITRNTE